MNCLVHKPASGKCLGERESSAELERSRKTSLAELSKQLEARRGTHMGSGLPKQSDQAVRRSLCMGPREPFIEEAGEWWEKLMSEHVGLVRTQKACIFLPGIVAVDLVFLDMSRNSQ